MLVPPVVAPVPRLLEYCASETGKRSPTKNVAGWLSSARSKIRRPWRTSESISEKLAAAPGTVARKVDAPPPKATIGGISPPTSTLLASGQVDVGGLRRRKTCGRGASEYLRKDGEQSGKSRF